MPHSKPRARLTHEYNTEGCYGRLLSEDTIYTRNDLQKVDVNTLEKIPTKQKKATRTQVEKDKEDSGIGARVRKARRRLFS